MALSLVEFNDASDKRRGGCPAWRAQAWHTPYRSCRGWVRWGLSEQTVLRRVNAFILMCAPSLGRGESPLQSGYDRGGHHADTAPSERGSLAPLSTPSTSRTSAPACPMTEV
ncbi:hypothetical protein OZ13_14815 [Xanthomonas cannabis pv. cannabis]|nr:hypothetical protein OZ10_17190 [Xanthomonas cannabis pv. cannabis]KHL53948.1 hypothetical protein OZ13_14815 [Xanthomonas cannabis pv. cannabis]